MNAVDTNVLVYAISGDAPQHQPKAKALLARLDPEKTVLLWQVACEFGAVTTKLARQGRLSEDPAIVLKALRQQYPLIIPSVNVMDLAIDIHQQHQVSYWDALLLAACAECGVKRLYTQDVQGMPVVRGVEIVNPFGG